MLKPFKSLALVATLAFRTVTGGGFLPAARLRGNVIVPDPKANKPTLEEQVISLTAARDAAVNSLATVTGERDAAQSALTSMTAERNNLQSQFDALTTTSQQLQTDLAAARTQIGTLTGDRDTARADAASAQANVQRLESLCNLKGIDPKSAVPSGDAKPGDLAAPKSEAEFKAAIASAKSQREKDSLLDAYSKAVKAGTIANA